MIDHIEENVTHSAAYVHRAKDHLVVARTLQAAAREKRNCCLMLTFGVLILIVVLVIFK
jgi:t-SNARE complex subunit (syntaxin)